MKPLEQTVRFKNARKKLRLANRRFMKLSKKEQRIAIAEDVILQVKAGLIVPLSTYFRPSHSMDAHLDAARDLELGTVIASCTSKSDPCKVCGIGSLFVSAVQKADNMKLKSFSFSASFDSSANMRKHETRYLKRWFDAEQLSEIERHYECRVEGIGYRDYPDKRMIKIMENIISNGGKFNPYKGAHKLW